MNSTWIQLCGVGLISAASLAAIPSSVSAAGGVQLGDIPSYSFRDPPVNALGARSLADLRGRPVLLDFWGRRCPSCVAGAVPASLKLQEAFGDDLTVLFVECQGASLDEAEGFAIGRRWMGGRALWTVERPVEFASRSLPYFVLLGSDGRVIAQGSPLAAQKEIEHRITEEIRRRPGIPADAPAAVRSAWGEYDRRHADRALALLRPLAATVPGADAVGCAARVALDEITRTLEIEFSRAGWLIDNRQFEEAQARLDALSGSLRGDAEWAGRIAQLSERLDSPELGHEREAAKRIGRAVARFYEEGGEAASAAELTQLAEQYAGTRAALEARRLVRVAGR